jgi:hypothetical protein
VLLRPGEDGVQLVVAQLTDRAPGRNPPVPQRLGEPHVPNACDQTLVEQGLANEARRVHLSNAWDEIRDVGVLGKEIRTEVAEWPALQCEHRPVPLASLPIAPAQHEPREPPQRRAARIEPPAATHAEMATEDDVAFESQEQMLPHRFDALEHASVEDARDAGRLPSRVRALDLEPLSYERLKEHRRPVERIALRHRSSRARLRARAGR